LKSESSLYRRWDDQPPRGRRRRTDESGEQISANCAISEISDSTFEITTGYDECLRRISAREAHIADRRRKAI
jgi:hypothetical protein